jgi:non-specific serine/threonine protein kinase
MPDDPPTHGARCSAGARRAASAAPGGRRLADRAQGEAVRLPDSLGLRYLDLLTRNPHRDLGALELVQLASSTGTRTAPVAGSRGDEVLDARARAEYRRRLTDLDESLAEAAQWNDTGRAARLRAEREFLIQELAAAAGLAGRPRRLGSDTERARLNVTRAVRAAITRIRDRAPSAGAHLDAAVHTGAHCSYRPPSEEHDHLSPGGT